MELSLLKLQLIYHNSSSKALLIKIFLLATAMALIPCLNLVYQDNCNNHSSSSSSWAIQTVNLRMNVSDLDASFRNLIEANWMIQGYKALSVGRDSIRAVMVMRKLGFRDAIGVVDRKPCSSLVQRGNIYKLPFKDESFDFVFSTAMIDGVRVPARMVLEMERVLRPGCIGVLLRRISGRFPITAIMKAAAPVESYLKVSEIVDVRMVNCTVMVVFKKRNIVGVGDDDGDGDGDIAMTMTMTMTPPMPRRISSLDFGTDGDESVSGGGGGGNGKKREITKVIMIRGGVNHD